MMLDSLSWSAPWAAPLAAGLLALAWAGLFRWRKRPATAGLGLALGALLGVTLLMGLVQASPRQLAERLPMLAAAALLLALPLALRTGRLAAGLMGLAAALATGWWMGGAPLVRADLAQAMPVVLTLGLVVPLAMIESAGPWRMAAAALALSAGLWAAGSAGPWVMLGGVLATAALAQQLASGAAAPATARLAFAMLLAGLLAGPVLARGAAPDWAAALAPLSLLLLAPRLPVRGWRAVLLMLLLGGLPVALAWWLAR